MCFYNVNRIVIETHPSGSYSIKVSIVDDNDGIEIRDFGMDDYVSKVSEISLYSRRLIRGFHRVVSRN
jgi:hypothetical protein